MLHAYQYGFLSVAAETVQITGHKERGQTILLTETSKGQVSCHVLCAISVASMNPNGHTFAFQPLSWFCCTYTKVHLSIHAPNIHPLANEQGSITLLWASSDQLCSTTAPVNTDVRIVGTI